MKRPLCAAALLFLCIQAIMVGGFRIALDLKPTRLEQDLKNKSAVALIGTVYRREEKPDYNILYLKDNQVLLNNKIYRESKILVYIETKNHIKIGNRVKLSGEAKVFQDARNPGDFDQKFYYQKQGIHVFVWADEAVIQDQKQYRIREHLAQIRAKWKALLIDRLGDYYGNSMSAILLGDKSELDSELKELYQKSGIGHILAISGLHMSFLGIGLYKLLRRAGLNFGIAGSLGICFLLAYTLMIGCGVSSLRALVMFIVRMGADITGRNYDMPTSLALAAAVIVAWQPLYLLDAGFLLSFGALLGIIAVNPCLEYCFIRDKKKKKWMQSVLASLSINLTLLPVMLYFYFEFPLYSVILNLLVIPMMSLLLGAGVAGSCIAIMSGQVGGIVLLLCKGIMALYGQACQLSIKLPMSRIVAGQPGKGAIVCYYVLLFCFCIAVHMSKIKGNDEAQKENQVSNPEVKQEDAISNRNQTSARDSHIGKIPGKLILGSLTLAVLCSLLFSTCYFKYRKEGLLAVTMLDVGQGDGLFLKTPAGTRCLIDGGSSDVSLVGKYRIEPFLKSQGIKTLDYVFISHGDADHMNGIEELLGNQQLGIRINSLILPPEEVQDDTLKALAATALENHTRVAVMKEGDTITEGDFRILCKAPTSRYTGEPGNAASMVLEVSFKEFGMLFTGDVEEEGEKELEENGALKEYDVLKVAHHGSKNSSSEEFLKQTKPEIAWISSGIHNRYGHPHPETVERLGQIGTRIYGTQESGAVTLVTDGEKIQMGTYL